MSAHLPSSIVPALVLEAQQLGAVLGGGDDRLHRREAHVGDEQLDVLRVLAVGAPDEAVVAAGDDADAGLRSLSIATQPSSHSSWYSVAASDLRRDAARRRR